VWFASPARAEVIYETTPPGGFLGFWGPDVFEGQSVAVRFTPSADFTLDRANVWFMNNDFKGGHPPVTLTLRTDDAKNGSIPSTTVLEQWDFNVSTVGWDPMLEQLDSVLHPTLKAGAHYWLVAQSDAPGGFSGVWVMAGESSGITSICNGIPCEWPPAGESAVPATIVEGTPVHPCPADVSGGDSVVNIDDLLAVINNWGQGAGNPADVTGNGIVDIVDLLAVINSWGGCP
jgi:hypothetical protein